MSARASAAGTKKLSVVVGAVESARSLRRCLEALEAGCAGLDWDLTVVSAGPEDAEVAVEATPDARVIVLPRDTLTPRLWSEGIACSTGSVVALTTGHCFVTSGWGSSLLASLDDGSAAAGGPMRLAADASATDAAIFFLRYSAFLEGAGPRTVRDIAGDNAAYVRAMIPSGSWTRNEGFWEVEVNREILGAGHTIVWAPDAVAEFGHSFGFAAISRHRFEHGRIFGKARVSSGRETRSRIVAASPVIPIVLASRIARRVARRPAYRTRFMLALPIILGLATSWAAGEAAGAMEA